MTTVEYEPSAHAQPPRGGARGTDVATAGPAGDGRYRTNPWSNPLSVLLLVLGLVILAETIIMLVLTQWAPPLHASLSLSLTDALLLAALLTPVLWRVVVRPLRLLAEQRGILLARVFDAQEDERARVAHDLHDELGQQLTAALLSLRTAESVEDRAVRSAGLQEARRLIAESLESVRRLARSLAPLVLQDLGLRAAVERLCEETARAAQFTIDYEFSIAAERLAPQIEIAIYRVVQEALTNVMRHANATRAVVRLARDGATLVMSVEDDGQGVPATGDPARQTGLGLAGMRERIALLGGALSVEPAHGSGTRLIARIPKVFSE